MPCFQPRIFLAELGFNFCVLSCHLLHPFVKLDHDFRHSLHCAGYRVNRKAEADPVHSGDHYQQCAGSDCQHGPLGSEVNCHARIVSDFRNLTDLEVVRSASGES